MRRSEAPWKLARDARAAAATRQFDTCDRNSRRQRLGLSPRAGSLAQNGAKQSDLAGMEKNGDGGGRSGRQGGAGFVLYVRQWAAERRAAHRPAQGQRKSHYKSHYKSHWPRQKQPLRALRPAEAGPWLEPQRRVARTLSFGGRLRQRYCYLPGLLRAGTCAVAAPVMLAGTAAANRRWVTAQAVVLHVPGTAATLISQLS